jgi:ATP-dependent DNA ligase
MDCLPVSTLPEGLEWTYEIKLDGYRLDEQLSILRDTPSHLGVDGLVVGFYRGKDLIYAARVRAGLVPATRREVFERLKHLKTPKCPFVNLSRPAAYPFQPLPSSLQMENYGSSLVSGQG